MASLEGNVDLSMGGYSLKRVQETKCLGVHTDENLTWSEHVNHISKKVVCNISVLRKIAPTLTLDNRITVYRSFIEPYFNYCSLVWKSISQTLSNKLQRLQNRAARVVTGLPYTVRSAQILEALGWLPLTEMRMQQKAIMMYKIIHGTAPKYMIDSSWDLKLIIYEI